MTRLVRLRALAFLLLGLTAPLAVAAQEQAAEPGAETEGASSAAVEAEAEVEEEVHPLVAEADALRSELRAMLAENDKLFQLETESQGEDAEALRRQREELGLRFMKQAGRFVENVLAREELGIDASADREITVEQLRSLGPRIESIVLQAIEEARALSREREQAAPEELEGIESRLAAREVWVDKALAAMRDHARHLERMGLPSERARGFLVETLPERAALLGGRIRLSRERVADAAGRLEEDPANAAVAADLRDEQRGLEAATGSLAATVALMEELGLDATEYKKLLFETTGKITTALLDREVLVRLLDDGWERVKTWTSEMAPGAVLRLARAVFVLALFWLLARITRRIVRRAASSSRFQTSQLLRQILMGLAARTVLLLGVLFALSQLGVQITALLAGLGIAGFIIGFALQDTLSNFASGAMILIYRPFDVGDVVEAGGVFGKVDRMSLVSTTLLTYDNQTLVVPNSKIWGNVIKNVTSQTIRRVDLVFRVGYGEDVERIESVLREVVGKHPKVLAEPEPLIKVHELGEFAMTFIVRPWVSTEDYWDVHWDLTREMMLRFQREGIEIPVPRRDLRIRDDGSGDA